MRKLYPAKVVNGKILFHNREAANKKIKSLEGKEIVITIEEKKNKIEWNKYYWHVPVKIVSNHTGSLPIQVHKYFKQKYLSEIIDVNNHGDVTPLDSSTKLTDEQWEYYINLIISGEAQEGYEIKKPGEIDYE